MLESQLHKDNAFVTLTYSNKHLPRVSLYDATLDPKHVQDWLKRIRKAYTLSPLRYYLVGEYGDDTQRPHYHVALFGFPSCRHAQTQYRNGSVRCCVQCHLVADTWGKGNVFLGTLETHSAQYVSGYVTKKMTQKDDPRLQSHSLLNPLHPEFARMSLRPGIGANAMHDVASTLMQFNLDTSQDDVPSALRHGSRTLPLSRYLRKKLRTYIGKDEKAPTNLVNEIQEELRAVRETSLDSKKTTGTHQKPKELLIKNGNQKVLQMEAKQRIFKKRKWL